MRRTTAIAGALALLATLSLSSCALTAKAWRRGLSGVRHRGGGALEVAELLLCPARDVLWCRYAISGGPESLFREHLHDPGWVAMRVRAAFWQELQHRAMEAEPFQLGIQVRKYQRGSEIRWRAFLDYTDRHGAMVHSEDTAWITRRPPLDDLQRFDLGAGQAFLTFDFYKRRSRAHLVTEAIVLTPPLIVADCACNFGRALAQVDWGEVLAEAILGGISKGISSGISKASGSSRKKGSRRAPRRSRNAKKPPSGPPRLGGQRRSR